MAKKVVAAEIEVKTANSIADLKALKKQLKDTAAGSDEFKKLYNQIDDLEDKIKGSKKASSDWIDTLEGAGGPLGAIGGALNKAKVATQSFGGALKATGIGLFVAAIGGLVAAFSQTEGSMKKLEPLMIGMEKIFGGIVKVAEPLIDLILDLGLKALPYVTDAIGSAYSVLSSFLGGLGKLGSAIGKLIKGDFVGAWDEAKKSVTEFGTRYENANSRFIAGTKEVTKTEKEELDKRAAARKDAADKEQARLEKAALVEKARLAKAAEEAKAYQDFEIQRQLDANKWAEEDAAKKEEARIKEQERNQASVKANADFEVQLAKDLLKVEEDATKTKIELAEAEKDAKYALANAIGNIASGLTSLFEQGTTAAKVAGLAEIAIGTGVGFIQGLDIAQKGAKAAGPAAPFAFPIFYATQIAAVLAAVSRAKSVMSQVKGGGGIQMPNAPSFSAPLSPQASRTTLNQDQVNQIGNVAARAFVVESDVSGNQERIQRLNRAARIN
jgi:hypothetical protein